jgi:hypothetical protein
MIKIAIVVACCGLCSSVPAVNPPPDGGYPSNNTAEGTDALFNLTTGFDNTAPVFKRSGATHTTTTTRPTVIMRSIATTAATTTRPTVMPRSIATTAATTTRPTVLVRSITIQAAAATSR